MAPTCQKFCQFFFGQRSQKNVKCHTHTYIHIHIKNAKECYIHLTPNFYFEWTGLGFWSTADLLHTQRNPKAAVECKACKPLAPQENSWTGHLPKCGKKTLWIFWAFLSHFGPTLIVWLKFKVILSLISLKFKSLSQKGFSRAFGRLHRVQTQCTDLFFGDHMCQCSPDPSVLVPYSSTSNESSLQGLLNYTHKSARPKLPQKLLSCDSTCPQKTILVTFLALLTWATKIWDFLRLETSPNTVSV